MPMYNNAPRAMSTTTSTGTGDLTLDAAAVAGFAKLQDVCTVGDWACMLIEAVDANGNPSGDWEIVLASYSATATISRATANVFASSNAGALVSFAAGTKRVSIVPLFDLVARKMARVHHVSHDCIAAAAGDFAQVVSGTGAAWSAQAVANNNTVGLVRLALGTTATGRGAIVALGTAVTCLRLGGGLARLQSVIYPVTLSDGTNTYSLRVGFIDSVSAESTDGVFFRYTHSVNSGRFQAVCRSNNVESVADTGVTYTAATKYDLELTVNPDGTSVEFRINGAVVATITSNIPTGAGRETGYGLMCLRSVGTAAVNAVDVDLIEVTIILQAER